MSLGRDGEALVALWYEQAGWRVLDRNWRDGRSGEIDLVLERNDAVVFCEVKTRTSTAFGAPVEAVSPRKQNQLRHLGAAWLRARSARPRTVRFDVASVIWPTGAEPNVEIFENAF